MDQILADDIPYGDATTALLGIEKVPGIVRCRPKAETTIAGVTLAERLFARVGLQTTRFHEEGDTVAAGTVILEGRGSAGAIHAVYKTAQNILEYASGIATRTHQMVEEARVGNPLCRVAVTRKHFPGTKTLSLYAAITGGAVVHRMGLSESVLVFDQHRVFIADFEKRLTEAQKADPERKIAVEAADIHEGLFFAAAGADIIQCENSPWKHSPSSSLRLNESFLNSSSRPQAASTPQTPAPTRRQALTSWLRHGLTSGNPPTSRCRSSLRMLERNDTAGRRLLKAVRPCGRLLSQRDFRFPEYVRYAWLADTPRHQPDTSCPTPS